MLLAAASSDRPDQSQGLIRDWPVALSKQILWTTRMTALRDYNAAVDFVDRNVAEGRGEKTAFIDPSRNLTYGELLDAAARIGPMLARMGVEPENRIALVLRDTVDFPVLFWGAIRAGIVPVLVNTRLTVDQYRDRKSTRLNSSHVKISYAV